MERTDGILENFNRLRTEKEQREYLIGVLHPTQKDRLGYTTLPLQDLLAAVLSKHATLQVVTQRNTRLQ